MTVIYVVEAIGAALVLGEFAGWGYRAHLLIVQHAPDLAAVLPRDSGAVLGILTGATIVAFWML